ncbi:glycosyltransferase [Frankia sp. Cppng1_Ct_nod]|uniref:glycosyltransferase n=1 Tax=Frankia sp. Cppng1_Ct_nod TaxID=2897162 RepID=UPI0010418DA3|nr:glycosyltransferase [Frankia sp. Cppng1_Ct_nod]
MTYPDEPTARDERREWPFELVIVSYHSRGQLEGMLAVLPSDIPVAIIDNAGGADRVDELISDMPNGRYLDSGGGKGFAKAANLGVRTSRHEYLIFGNPDSRPTVAVMNTLVADVREDPELALSAATMAGHDNRPELGNGGWEPTPRRVLMHVLGAHRIAPTVGLFARPTPDRAMDVEWLTGACLAVRRRIFLALGGFDENFFVYSEDMALGRKVREAGLRQRLRTDLLVPHGAGGSGAAKTWMLQMRGASMMKYLGMHNAASRVRLMQSMLVAGYAGRAALSRARGDTAAAAEHSSYVRGLVCGPPAP